MRLINKILNSFILSIIVLVFGCQKPVPVEIVDEQDDSKYIEVTALGNTNDSIFVSSGIDTTGLISLENSKYFAKMIMTGIRYDRTNRFGNIIMTESISAEAIFLDKSKPIQQNGHLMTYPSFDVGNIKINSDSLSKFQRLIRFQMPVVDSVIGYVYRLRRPYNYEQSYLWSADGKGTIGSFQVAFTPANVIQVLNLPPDTIHTSVPLFIKWQCSNPTINIIISGEEDILYGSRKLKPILILRIKNNKGEITLPVKILQMIPLKQFQRFLFTFSSESKFTTSVSGYPDPVLIHSASIHNILLNVCP
jgi:hypothetical protein